MVREPPNSRSRKKLVPYVPQVGASYRFHWARCGAFAMLEPTNFYVQASHLAVPSAGPSTRYMTRQDLKALWLDGNWHFSSFGFNMRFFEPGGVGKSWAIFSLDGREWRRIGDGRNYLTYFLGCDRWSCLLGLCPHFGAGLENSVGLARYMYCTVHTCTYLGITDFPGPCRVFLPALTQISNTSASAGYSISGPRNSLCTVPLSTGMCLDSTPDVFLP